MIEASTRAFGMVAAVCLLVQLASATVLVRDFTTPNASTAIARNLVATGRYVLIGGPDGSHAPTPRRAFQLPGEPVYLAVGFLVVPDALHRYLHVPITLMFVMAVTMVALVIGGKRLGLITGLIASLDPFLAVHGPVWDDTFLAAALEWSVFAALLVTLRDAGEGKALSRLRMSVLVGCVASLAAGAALTRLQSQMVLGLTGVALVMVPVVRPIRWLGGALLGGLALALGAWGVRNLLVLGAFFIGSSHDGQTLYQSMHQDARRSIVQTGVAQGLLELPFGSGLGELEEDRAFTQRAWADVRARPATTLTTAVFKAAVSLSGYSFTTTAWSVRNIAAVGGDMVLLIAAPWGWARWRRRQNPSRVGWLLILLASVTAMTTGGLLAVGPVGMRYWITARAFLYVGTGMAVLESASR